MRPNQSIEVAQDSASLGRKSAEIFASLASDAIRKHGMFRVALSGGNTPRLMYDRLAEHPFRDSIEWFNCQIFFSDERFVPPDSPESNFHTAYESLLSRVPIPEKNVFPVPTVNLDPTEAASEYEGLIRRIFSVSEREIPRFDLILLGLGPDGHTASLFPGTQALHVRDKLVVSNYVPAFDSWRITFTYPLINAAAVVAFLVEGREKALRVSQVLERSADLPAADVQLENGRLIWLLDAVAASQYRGTPPPA